MPDEPKNKTISTRITEESFDTVKQRLEDRDYSMSDLQRFPVRMAAAEDKDDAEVFLDFFEEVYRNEKVESWTDHVDSFLDGNPGYIERLSESSTTGELDKDRIEEGVKKMLSGVYFRDSDTAMEGGRMLDELDPGTGDTAIKYLSRFPEEYWQQ